MTVSAVPTVLSGVQVLDLFFTQKVVLSGKYDLSIIMIRICTQEDKTAFLSGSPRRSIELGFVC